jgi:hypothetical protein
MFPVAIFLFLVCAVLAWSFRVWILIPITSLAIASQLIADAVGGATAGTMMTGVLLMALAPQLGFAFGLFTRYVQFALRTPLASGHHQSAVAKLYKQNADSYSVAEVRRGPESR